jgi:hypothetical protein
MSVNDFWDWYHIQTLTFPDLVPCADLTVVPPRHKAATYNDISTLRSNLASLLTDGLG